VSLFVAELVLRQTMGFEWSLLHLQPAIITGTASESYQKPVIDRHVGNLPVATGMQLSWIYDVPPPQQRGAIVTRLEERYENYGRKGIYAINRTLLTQRICEGSDRYLGRKLFSSKPALGTADSLTLISLYDCPHRANRT